MIWILLIIMQFKHFIADYPLQGKYMLGKFKETGWVLPLSFHCGVHFLFTFVITFIILQSLFHAAGFGAIDFVIHFIMDRIKASPNLLGKYKALSKTEALRLLNPENGYQKDYIEFRFKENTIFWWSLGLDQMVHHLTDILIVYLIWSVYV